MGVGHELDSHLWHHQDRVTWVRGCRPDGAVVSRIRGRTAPPNATCSAFLSSVSTQRGSPNLLPDPCSETPVGSFARLGTQRFPAGNKHGSPLDVGDCQTVTLWHVTVIQRIDRPCCADASRLAMRFARWIGIPGWLANRCDVSAKRRSADPDHGHGTGTGNASILKASRTA
jgi:hypothetical protein